MVTATPDTLPEVLRQVVQQAQRTAAAQPQRFEDLYHRLEQDAEDAWADLKELVKHPDWWSLLVFIFVQIRELDPANITVGTMQRVGWSRIVTLTYHEGPAAVTLGLGITDPDVTHGLLLKVDGALTKNFGNDAFAVTIKTADDHATWEIPFSGPPPPPKPNDPDAPAPVSASLEASISWDPHLRTGNPDPAGVTVGPLYLDAVLSYNNVVHYAVELGLGRDGRPGVQAQVTTKSLLGPLSDVVNITPVNETYSPKVRLADGESPTFTLGQHSLA